MDTGELILEAKNFLEEFYLNSVLSQLAKGKQHLTISFINLCEYSFELAEELLDNTEETLKMLGIAAKQLDNRVLEEFLIRLTDLPQSTEIRIGSIRCKHIDKLVSFTGTVRQKADVRPIITAARFECPSCGNVIPVLQLTDKFVEPSRCGCGRKGKFRVISKEKVDYQAITIEESLEDLEGDEQPKKFKVALKNDLVTPIMDRMALPGSKVRITGIVKEVPVRHRQGGLSTKLDLVVEANNIEPMNEDFSKVEVTEEDIKNLREIAARNDLVEAMSTSLAPSVCGMDRIKEALLIQMIGGVRKIKSDKNSLRGDIHILLVGDPGVAKSQLLKRVAAVAPKSRFVSGKGASGAGLTAALVKDEFIGGWALEAGALPMTHKGQICIDELDKMSHDDTSHMHEALEGQTITVAKGNVQTTLHCQTTVLAAANPKYGRFDPYDLLAKQITLPNTLMNRFDLIFPIKDEANFEQDKKVFDFILNCHIHSDSIEQPIEDDLLKKHIAYSKTINPTISREAAQLLQSYFLPFRSRHSNSDSSASFPINMRLLEGLIRLTEAYARLRLSGTAEHIDAQRAISLFDYCMRQVAFDEETGEYDFDKIDLGVKGTEQRNIQSVRQIIGEITETIGRIIPIEDITKKAADKGISEDQVEQILQKFSKMGDIHEPKAGFIERI